MGARQLLRRRPGRWLAGAIQTGTLAVRREIRMPDVFIAHALSRRRKNSIIGRSSSIGRASSMCCKKFKSSAPFLGESIIVEIDHR
jgi:hypothetical protein